MVTAATLGTRIYSSIDDVGKEQVDSIADDGFFTYGWLKTLEMSKPFDLLPRHVALYDGEKLVALAPCFEDLAGEYSRRGPYIPHVYRLLRTASRVKLFRDHVLICYSPLSLHSKFLYSREYDVGAVCGLLLEGISDICRRDRMLFSYFLFVSEADKALVSGLQGHGYTSVPWIDTYYMDVNWSDFDGYLASLPHKIRLNVRREIKKCAQSGIAIESVENFGEIAGELSKLCLNVFSKYGRLSYAFYPVSFFDNLSVHASDKTKVFVAKKAGRIVGFSLSLRQGATADCYLCGFDYENQSDSDFTYFNVVYYASVRWAVEEGIRRIHFGTAQPGSKLRRGCRVDKTFSFIKCHSGVLDPAFRAYVKRRFA